MVVNVEYNVCKNLCHFCVILKAAVDTFNLHSEYIDLLLVCVCRRTRQTSRTGIMALQLPRRGKMAGTDMIMSSWI